MTIHKAQGRTLSAVILCLSKRLNAINQMTFNSIYVALSRVKSRHDIQILIHGQLYNPEEFSYLFDMKKPASIDSFMHGFLRDQTWDGQMAYQHFLDNNL